MNDLFANLEAQNGEHITVDGKNYFFTQQPYCDNGPDCEAHFFAVMISDADPVDDDGCVDAYEVMWDLLPGWDGEDCCDACDWQNPDQIRRICGFDTNDCRCC